MYWCDGIVFGGYVNVELEYVVVCDLGIVGCEIVCFFVFIVLDVCFLVGFDW